MTTRQRKQLTTLSRLRQMKQEQANATLAHATAARHQAETSMRGAQAELVALVEEQRTQRIDGRAIDPGRYSRLLEASLAASETMQLRAREHQARSRQERASLDAFVLCRSQLRVVETALEELRLQTLRRQEQESGRDAHDQYSRYATVSETR